MPTIEIRITVPDGAQVSIEQLSEGQSVAPSPPVSQIAAYWRQYLSDNGRKVFRAAARIEDLEGPGFTLDDIAGNLSVTTEAVQSWHRTTGRTAKKWREQTDTQEPIRLEEIDYVWNEEIRGMRTTYRLPAGVRQEIIQLAMA